MKPAFIPSFRSALIALLFAACATAQTNTTVSLSPTRADTFYGTAVSLRATVSPNPTGGTVTFYDGTNIVGTSPVTAGVATYSTTALQPGDRKLKARFTGTTGFNASVSAVTPLSVTGLFRNEFNASRNHKQ